MTIPNIRLCLVHEIEAKNVGIAWQSARYAKWNQVNCLQRLKYGRIFQVTIHLARLIERQSARKKACQADSTIHTPIERQV